jgi:hypothetical protein
VAGKATVMLSADKAGYPAADISPARRRNPDAFLTDLLRRYPHDVVGVIDAMAGALRVPLTRAQILDRLAAGGIPGFAALAIEL